MPQEKERSNITPYINQALFGLNTDNIEVKPGMLTYALNAQVDSFDGNTVTYQNEQSNVLGSEFKTGFRVVANHPIVEQNRTILFLCNPSTGESEIGQINNIITCDVDNPTNLGKVSSKNYVNNGYSNIDTYQDVEGSSRVVEFYELYKKVNQSKSKTKPLGCNTYTTLISDPCLGFDVTKPVKKIVHRIVTSKDDALCGTEIYWAQKDFPRRFVNLDHIPFKEIVSGCERIRTAEIDCSLMEVNPTIQMPIIEPELMADDGSLIAGAYQFGIQYCDQKAAGYTGCLSITNEVTVFKSTYGLDYDFETNKSIKISVSNLDTRFNYFNLIVIKTINGATTPEIAGTYEVLGDKTDIIYSGSNKTAVKLSMEDVFQRNPYYGEAEDLTVVDNTLIWTNLKGNKKISYQSVANNIKLQWETYQIPAESYADGINTALYRGYMRDEVYALEFVPILRHGEVKEGAHIPGREAKTSDLTLLSPGANDDVLEEESVPAWKVYNTASIIGKDPSYLAATNKSKYKGPYEYGEFAYWESEKTYPCNKDVWGDLSGKNIRHHKFPDNLITHIHDNNPDSDQTFDHHIYPIGIRVDLENIRQAIINSDLTDEDKANIIGFKIIRSDRVNNKSVIAKGLLYNVGAYTPYSEGNPSSSKSVFYPNYPFNDLGSDPFLTHLSSVSDGGFNFSLLDIFSNKLDTINQAAEILSSNLSTLIVPISYKDSSGNEVISLKSSPVIDLQNRITTLKESIQALYENIESLQDYYSNKTEGNQPVCSSDVPSLTISISDYNGVLGGIDNINNSSSFSTFQSIVDNIDTNSSMLDDTPNATDIFNLRNSLKGFIANNKDLQDTKTLLTQSYSDYNTELTELSSVSCTGSVVSESSFSKTRFTFHSPDTHFFQPTLGSVLKFETVEGGIAYGNFVRVKGHSGHKLISAAASGIALAAGVLVGALFAAKPVYHYHQALGSGVSFYAPSVLPPLGEMADKALFWNKEFKTMIMNLIPNKNYAYQYNAVGYYNKYNTIQNSGNKQRLLDKAYYINSAYQSIGDTNVINNWNRESSVYFRLDQTREASLLPNDSNIRGSLPEDDSRVPYSSDAKIESNILSYYASHKRKMSDQYGDIFSYNTVDTGFNAVMDYQQSYAGKTATVFGGDIFINRFGLKRKLSYFIDTAVGRPDGADIDYSDLSNIGKVKYWYNTSTSKTPKSGFKGLMNSILGAPQSNMDGNSHKLFYQNGRIYLYSYGIAYFFTESEVNVDFRQAGNNSDKDFFPNVGNGIPNDWLQEINVPIVHDNYYIYNKTYSKQNKESYFPHLPLNFDPDDSCNLAENFDHRAIYSDTNKWRIYKPISYFDFPNNYGKLTAIDTINNSQVLVRFENKSYIYNALTAIQTSSGKYAYLGNDDVFKSRPIDFGDTDLGYAGSQHKLFIKSEAGSLFIDALRGQIFLIKGNSVDTISDKYVSRWFSNNLPFKIVDFFPGVDIDNAYNGIGLTGVWDGNYNRFIITKLDYVPKPEYRSDITYSDNKFYYKNIEILITDPKYFCNKSWTLSYHVKLGAWVSYHSYLPNYYIGQNGFFLSGNNAIFSNQKSSLWVHGIIHTSFQNFYGKKEPYILEYPFDFKTSTEMVQNVQDYTTILEYYNEQDFYEINDGVYFNKSVLFNGQQCSGVLNLYPKPRGKMNFYLNYPKYNKDSKDIIYTKSDNLFNYNTFWDVVKNPNNHYPIWIDSCDNKSIGRELNNSMFDYSSRAFQKTKLRAKNLKVRHINDLHDRYKFISRFINVDGQISYK